MCCFVASTATKQEQSLVFASFVLILSLIIMKCCLMPLWILYFLLETSIRKYSHFRSTLLWVQMNTELRNVHQHLSSQEKDFGHLTSKNEFRKLTEYLQGLECFRFPKNHAQRSFSKCEARFSEVNATLIFIHDAGVDGNRVGGRG